MDNGVAHGYSEVWTRLMNEYELSSEHFKAINTLANKYGRRADSSPDLEERLPHSSYTFHTKQLRSPTTSISLKVKSSVNVLFLVIFSLVIFQ